MRAYLGTSLAAVGAASADAQLRLSEPKSASHHQADAAVLAALEKHADPVDALLSLHPERADELAQPRLLRILDGDTTWMTEGDKLRLKRQGKKFADVTDHDEFIQANQRSSQAAQAHLPTLSHQGLVKSLLPLVSTQRLRSDLETLTSFYSRYYICEYGERSALWLHDQIAEVRYVLATYPSYPTSPGRERIIRDSPFHSHISLEYFTHDFPQPSILARFEPRVRNSSLPLTILGAHQDSMNYESPLLPAPGADDDGSGTISSLEAFRVLARSGFVPLDGPVEFHWYAAEEGGLLGSQAVARDKKESGARIGAMLNLDMTGFLARNKTEGIALIETQTDGALTRWTTDLAGEYLSIPAKIGKFPR
ncbi:hypothetical protein E4U42_007012 [Claviceps africana]|uniref:Peptide hydrolase n=1 Tax=Claviceps africana TaxID=83212 RepID=A0A8K0NGG0_9HYPO|nr:hypothetical protein E4U42_007012 [Claviceps africana]